MEGYESNMTKYSHFLCSGNVPTMLEDDIHQWEQQPFPATDSTEVDPTVEEVCNLTTARGTEEWMLIYQHDVATTASVTTRATTDWGHDTKQDQILQEAATFITSQCETAVDGQPLVTTSDPKCLQGKQLEAFSS